MNGDVFLFDEPFQGIDKELKEKIIKIILGKTKDKLLVIVTHNEEEAKQIADTIIYVDGIPLKIVEK